MSVVALDSFSSPACRVPRDERRSVSRSSASPPPPTGSLVGLSEHEALTELLHARICTHYLSISRIRISRSCGSPKARLSNPSLSFRSPRSFSSLSQFDSRFAKLLHFEHLTDFDFDKFRATTGEAVESFIELPLAEVLLILVSV